MSRAHPCLLTADRDRGSASVWVLGLAAVLALAVTAAVLAGSAMVLRHKASAAADLSALAAASTALDGPTAACAAAAEVVAGMDAQLTSCTLSGRVAEVRVTVTADLGLVGEVTAEGFAWAGPVSSAPPAG